MSDAELSQLLKVLFRPDYKALTVICDQLPEGKKKEMAECLIRVAEARVAGGEGDSLAVMRHFINKEVQALGADQRGTLFRNNSMASKMTTFYFTLHGRKYLRDVLQREIQRVCARHEEDSELDLTTEAKAGDVSLIAQRILDNVLEEEEKEKKKEERGKEDACAALPLNIRRVAQIMWTAVESRFPESTMQAIGGLLFLRYLCPALATPVAANMIEGVPTTKAGRTLVLISKILQTAANMVTAYDKEPSMQVFNTFLSSNQQRLGAFFKSVGIPSHADDAQQVPCSIIPKDQQRAAMVVLYTHFQTYRDAIRSQFPTNEQYLVDTLPSPSTSTSTPTPTPTPLPPLGKVTSAPLPLIDVGWREARAQSPPPSPHSDIVTDLEYEQHMRRKMEERERAMSLHHANMRFEKALGTLSLKHVDGEQHAYASNLTTLAIYTKGSSGRRRTTGEVDERVSPRVHHDASRRKSLAHGEEIDHKRKQDRKPRPRSKLASSEEIIRPTRRNSEDYVQRADLGRTSRAGPSPRVRERERERERSSSKERRSSSVRYKTIEEEHYRDLRDQNISPRRRSSNLY